MKAIAYFLILCSSLTGCSYGLHSVKTGLTEDVALQVKLQSYKKRKGVTYVSGELNAAGTKNKLQSIDLNCIHLRHRAIKSEKIEFDFKESHTGSQYEAKAGFVTANVVWTFSQEVSTEVLQNLKVEVDKTCNNNEWISFYKM